MADETGKLHVFFLSVSHRISVKDPVQETWLQLIRLIKIFEPKLDFTKFLYMLLSWSLNLV